MINSDAAILILEPDPRRAALRYGLADSKLELLVMSPIRDDYVRYDVPGKNTAENACLFIRGGGFAVLLDLPMRSGGLDEVGFEPAVVFALFDFVFTDLQLRYFFHEGQVTVYQFARRCGGEGEIFEETPAGFFSVPIRRCFGMTLVEEARAQAVPVVVQDGVFGGDEALACIPSPGQGRGLGAGLPNGDTLVPIDIGALVFQAPDEKLHELCGILLARVSGGRTNNAVVAAELVDKSGAGRGGVDQYDTSGGDRAE